MESTNTPLNLQLPKIGERYRHYKSTGGNDHLYEIVGVARHTEHEPDEPEFLMVAYKPLYHSQVLEDYKLDFFVRPLSLFWNEVEWEGKTVQRFTRENI
jgi:hypothetical protein